MQRESELGKQSTIPRQIDAHTYSGDGKSTTDVFSMQRLASVLHEQDADSLNEPGESLFKRSILRGTLCNGLIQMMYSTK